MRVSSSVVHSEKIRAPAVLLFQVEVIDEQLLYPLYSTTRVGRLSALKHKGKEQEITSE